MNYKITGTRKQFEELYYAVGHYYTLYTGGDIRGYLNTVAISAFNKNIEKHHLSESRKFHEQDVIQCITKNINDILLEDRLPEGRKKEELADIENLYKTDLYSRVFNVNEKDFSMTVSSEELKMLSYICDTIMRFICGQTFAMVDGLMSCWSKFHNEDAEDYFRVHDLVHHDVKLLHILCWDQEENRYYGIHYNETSDILFDMHQVFRHALWEELPEKERTYMTVDSDIPQQNSSEPLLSINKEKE